MINKLHNITAMIGITAWQREDVIHIEIEVNTLINAAIILVIVSLITLGYQLTKEYRLKHNANKSSNH